MRPDVMSGVVRAVSAELLNSVDSGRLKAGRAGIEAARDAALARIDAIDRAYAEAGEKLRGTPLVVAHDAFGWLGELYGFEFQALSGVDGSEPSPGAVAAAIGTIRERGLKVVYMQPQLNAALVERIGAETGARVLMLDPLGDGDWFAMMESNLQAMLAGVDPDGN